MAPKQLFHDTFCWDCCREGTTLECIECIRSYHTRCLPQNHPMEPRDWLCPKCTFIRARRNICSKKQLEILPVVINKVWRNEKFEDIMILLKGGNHSPFNLSGDIANPMNLKIISNKCDIYTSFQEFMADVQWIHHNCRIWYSDDKKETKLAISLVDYLKEEISTALKCIECYLNEDKHPSEWFTMACNEPHLVIWAVNKDAVNYPAKLMSVKSDLALVRFFGNHSQDIVDVAKCSLYSKGNAKLYNNRLHKTLKEVDLYVENLELKFGRCQWPEVESVFDPALVDQYINHMIPGLATYRARQKTPLKQRSNQGSNGGVKKLECPMPTNQKEFNAPLSKRDIKEAIPKKFTSTIVRSVPDELDWKEDLQSTMRKVTGAYEKMIASNEALENQLKDKNSEMESMMKAQNQKIKSLEENKRTLTAQIEKSDKRFRELENFNTALIGQVEEVEFKMKYQHEKQITALQRQHEAEVKALKDEIRKITIERNDAVNEVKERCKTLCTAQIEEAKINKYCAACGMAKSLGVTFCDIGCAREYSKS